MNIDKDLLHGILDRLHKTERFVLKEAPLVMRELVIEGLIDLIPTICVCLLSILIGLWSTLTIKDSYTLYVNNSSTLSVNNSSNESLMIIVAFKAIFIVVAILSVMSLIDTIKEIARVYLTPKLYLIRKVRELLFNSKGE